MSRPPLSRPALRPAAFALLSMVAPLVAACQDDRVGTSPASCGPAVGTVSRVIDGDTIELASGERVRYLLIDANELAAGECFATEARDFNVGAVEGREVELEYAVECTDDFGRLLAYVRVAGRDLNELLVERGYACVLFIPPNGDDRVARYRSLEQRAESQGQGMWSACDEVACD